MIDYLTKDMVEAINIILNSNCNSDILVLKNAARIINEDGYFTFRTSSSRKEFLEDVESFKDIWYI